METKPDSNDANMVEQLDLLISREKSQLLNSLHDHGKVEEKLELFMGNLQQQIDVMLESGASGQPLAVENSEEATEAMRLLEDEYSNYNINQANHIINHRRTHSYFMKGSLMGGAVAAGLMWFLMPQAWQDQVDLAFEKSVIAVESFTEGKRPSEMIGNAVDTATTGAVEIVEQAVVSVEVAKEGAVEIVEQAIESVKSVNVGVADIKPTVADKSVSDEIKGELVAAVKEPVLNDVKPVVDSKVESLLDHGNEPEPVAKMKEPETFIGQQLTVTAHVANARNIPDNKGKRVTRVKLGDVVTKLNEQLGWYQVKIEDGTVAWVYKSVFAPRLQVLVGIGNVRLEPSGKAKILARINHGDFVTKLDEKNGWYLVKLDSGVRAWGHHSIF